VPLTHLVEEMLQLLICEIDAPLLKAVVVKVFKAKNIKDALREWDTR
jgi:hypothetical protein